MISNSGRERESTNSTSVGNMTNEFLDFLDETPSPWHVAAVCKKKLLQAGFVELKESESWNIQPNKKFFFQREALTAAFITGSNWRPGNEFSLVAGHIDSPCLRLRQKSEKSHDVSALDGLIPLFLVLVGLDKNRTGNVRRGNLAHVVR